MSRFISKSYAVRVRLDMQDDSATWAGHLRVRVVLLDRVPSSTPPSAERASGRLIRPRQPGRGQRHGHAGDSPSVRDVGTLRDREKEENKGSYLHNLNKDMISMLLLPGITES